MPLRPDPTEAVDDGGGKPDMAHNSELQQSNLERSMKWQYRKF